MRANCEILGHNWNRKFSRHCRLYVSMHLSLTVARIRVSSRIGSEELKKAFITIYVDIYDTYSPVLITYNS